MLLVRQQVRRGLHVADVLLVGPVDVGVPLGVLRRKETILVLLADGAFIDAPVQGRHIFSFI